MERGDGFLKDSECLDPFEHEHEHERAVRYVEHNLPQPTRTLFPTVMVTLARKSMNNQNAASFMS